MLSSSSDHLPLRPPLPRPFHRPNSPPQCFERFLVSWVAGVEVVNQIRGWCATVSYLGIVALPCCIKEIADRKFLVLLAGVHLETISHRVHCRVPVCPHLRLELFYPLSMPIASLYSLLHNHGCEPFDSSITNEPAYSYCGPTEVLPPPLAFPLLAWQSLSDDMLPAGVSLALTQIPISSALVGPCQLLAVLGSWAHL